MNTECSTDFISFSTTAANDCTWWAQVRVLLVRIRKTTDVLTRCFCICRYLAGYHGLLPDDECGSRPHPDCVHSELHDPLPHLWLHGWPLQPQVHHGSWNLLLVNRHLGRLIRPFQCKWQFYNVLYFFACRFLISRSIYLDEFTSRRNVLEKFRILDDLSYSSVLWL